MVTSSSSAPVWCFARLATGAASSTRLASCRYAADHGYPVPEVHDVRANGSEIIIQRIDGPLMMEPMAKRPWTIPRYASLLADLHDQLHEIPAPDWLGQSSDGGDRLVHLDLHPLNVLLSAGPGGDRLVERSPRRGVERCRAHVCAVDLPTYAWTACSADRRTARTRGPGSAVCPALPRPGLTERIAVAADLKTLDQHMMPDEIANLHRLAHRMGRERDTILRQADHTTRGRSEPAGTHSPTDERRSDGATTNPHNPPPSCPRNGYRAGSGQLHDAPAWLGGGPKPGVVAVRELTFYVGCKLVRICCEPVIVCSTRGCEGYVSPNGLHGVATGATREDLDNVTSGRGELPSGARREFTPTFWNTLRRW